MTVSRLRDRRDSETIVRLINWSRAINAAWQDGPRQNAKSASWHGLVEDKYPDEGDPPTAIDEDDAERTQRAMGLFMGHDSKTANVLIAHYRDGFDVRGLRRARNRFWRWL